MLDVKREVRVPSIQTELPGPKARRMVERDERVTSPSYTPRVYPLVVARGEGVMIEDVDGNRFLDFNAGIAVCSTGHCRPRRRRGDRSAGRESVAHVGTDFYYPAELRARRKLDADFYAGKFASGSSSRTRNRAVEAAFNSRGITAAANMITFYGAFHGRTIGAVSLDGQQGHAPTRLSAARPRREYVRHANFAAGTTNFPQEAQHHRAD